MERGNWTKVPNEVFDFLMKDLNGAEFKVFTTLIRLTTGFNKKRDLVSYDQLEERTGLARGSIAAAIKSLQTKNLVSKNSRGYAINHTQIVQKLDSLASKTEIVQKLDSIVQKLDSDSIKTELYSRGQIVQKLDSQKTKETPFKETPPNKEALQAPPGWGAAYAALVGLGVAPLLVSELLGIAEKFGRDEQYILDIAGYVARPDIKAKNPAGMAITLIKSNTSRNVEASQEPLQSSTRQRYSIPGQKHHLYDDGGEELVLHDGPREDCPICSQEEKD